MKRIYILEGLDCANCAEEIRAEVEKDERVKSAEMNFMKQELTVEAENSCSPDELMTTVTEVVAKHEPDVTVRERQTFEEKKYIIDGLDCAQCAEEVREAAMLDGASGLKQDWFITIPMIKGTLKTVSILAATAGFLLYNEVYFLTKGAAGTYSISYVIRELAITSPRTQFGRANAVALIQILAGLVIILIINFVYSVSLKKEKH